MFYRRTESERETGRPGRRQAPKPKPYTVEAIRGLDPPSCRRDTRASCSNSSTRTTAEPTSRPFSPAYTSNRIGSAILSAGRFSRRRSSASRLHDGRECRWLFRLGTNAACIPHMECRQERFGTLPGSWPVRIARRAAIPRSSARCRAAFRSRFPNAMRHEAQPYPST